MRIAYCIGTLAIGGAEKQTLLLADEMRGRGHSVLILVLFRSDAVELETKLPVLRLNQKRSVIGMLRAQKTAMLFLTAFDAEILHSHTYPANLFARLLHMRGFQGSVVNTFHNVVEGGWLRMLLYRASRRWMTAATAVSEAVREQTARKGLAAEEKIFVIPNGIVIRDFCRKKCQQEMQRRKALREELADKEAFVWIAVGRIALAKDYPNLLRAFARVRAEETRCELWVVGGVAMDRREAENRALLRKIESAAGVRWLGTRTDVPALMIAADGFVSSSAWEGAPLVVAEAMAAEIPIVATDVGGVKEIVGDCGEVVEKGNGEALAAAMLRVMSETRERRVRRARDGRQRVEERFSMEAIAAQWERFYADVTLKAEAER
jgi:Glycosyltransferase